MTISIACYVVAVILCVLAAFGWKPWCLPIGLAFFALAHVLVGGPVLGKP